MNERTAADGKILTAPSPQELQTLAAQLAAAKPQSIAISLLFSFANPKNEEAVAEALTSLTVPLSISHQILPEFREYERTSTVVINAYLQPVMQSYLENLEKRSRRDVARNVCLATSTPRVAAGASPAQVREEHCEGKSLGVAQRRTAAKSANLEERDEEEQRFSAVRGANVEEWRFSALRGANVEGGALAPRKSPPKILGL